MTGIQAIQLSPCSAWLPDIYLLKQAKSDFSNHATVPLPFRDQVRPRLNHVCLSDAAQNSKNKHATEAHIFLETGALPIELLPYGCVMMIAERECFVKALTL